MNLYCDHLQLTQESCADVVDWLDDCLFTNTDRTSEQVKMEIQIEIQIQIQVKWLHKGYSFNRRVMCGCC